MPSATLEEYLEAIYKLSEKGEVRPTQLADALGVSGPTVTATLRRLEAADLVDRPAGGVALTDAGRTQALSILRRHRLVRALPRGRPRAAVGRRARGGLPARARAVSAGAGGARARTWTTPRSARTAIRSPPPT